jgi:hypothetical protein
VCVAEQVAAVQPSVTSGSSHWQRHITSLSLACMHSSACMGRASLHVLLLECCCIFGSLKRNLSWQKQLTCILSYPKVMPNCAVAAAAPPIMVLLQLQPLTHSTRADAILLCPPGIEPRVKNKTILRWSRLLLSAPVTFVVSSVICRTLPWPLALQDGADHSSSSSSSSDVTEMRARVYCLVQKDVRTVIA